MGGRRVERMEMRIIRIGNMHNKVDCETVLERMRGELGKIKNWYINKIEVKEEEKGSGHLRYKGCATIREARINRKKKSIIKAVSEKINKQENDKETWEEKQKMWMEGYPERMMLFDNEDRKWTKWIKAEVCLTSLREKWRTIEDVEQVLAWIAEYMGTEKEKGTKEKGIREHKRNREICSV